MRKILNGLGLVATVLILAGTVGCQSVSEPTPDAIKGVRVLEQPDPTTLQIFGHVTAHNTVAPDDLRRAEELTLERLKAAAIREFPDTAVLFHVVILPGDGMYTFNATGIAARRRGS